MNINAVSRLAHKMFVSKGSREKATLESHTRSWRVKCQAVFHEYFARQAISQGTCETLYMEDLSVTFLSFTHTISSLPIKVKDVIFREKILDRFLQHNIPTF